MIDFSKAIKTSTIKKKIEPLELYNSLDRKSEAGPLRPTQEQVLKIWHENKRDDKDAIVKLHTGAGKTLIGLLMALSFMNENDQPSLYVCPNIYLMQQVCSEALKFGIPFCIIEKGNYDIPNDFINSKKILITYVQKVFNGLSIFGLNNRSFSVGCIVLDDSHACIDSIVSACTITIEKKDGKYSKLIQLFEDDLKLQSEGTYYEIKNNDTSSIIPIPYWNWKDKISQVIKLFASDLTNDNIKFVWPILKDVLNSCDTYVSSKKIEIVPQCIPIKKFGVFNNADHRILMSATTQEDTFFIKGLGLSSKSIVNPIIDQEYKWSGEKMILIPSLMCDNISDEEIIKSIITAKHDRAGIVVLSNSFKNCETYTNLNCILANRKDTNMFNTINTFKRDGYKKDCLVFANRYDGIDLPDDTCRILVIDSLPYYDSLSDRYEELCRSNSDIVKIKTIQKVEQALGRSVRGEKDYSVIIITGSDLIKYLKSSDNKKLFSEQTKKQIDIGFEIINMSQSQKYTEKEKQLSNFISTINQCMQRDDSWKTFYSNNMNQIEILNYNRNHLYAILEKEKKAYDEYVIGNVNESCNLINEIIQITTDDFEKGWFKQLLAKYKFDISKKDSEQIQISAFKLNNELLKPINGIKYNKISYAMDDSRINLIKNKFLKYNNYQDLKLEFENSLSNLCFGSDHEKFESTIQFIGELLGFKSQRPDKEIRKGPDNLWCVSKNKYIMIECKNEVDTSRVSIHKSEAAQMEEHCGWFEAEYNNSDVTNVLIIPPNKLDDNAYFSHSIKILRKEGLYKLKNDLRKYILEFEKYDIHTMEDATINTLLLSYNFVHCNFINKYIENPKK